MTIFLGFVISALLLIFQYFLSESSCWQLGGIIPLFVFILFLWCFFFRTPKLSLQSIIPLSILFILLLWDWSDGRKRFKKRKNEKIKNELKKMNAQDLDDQNF